MAQAHQIQSGTLLAEIILNVYHNNDLSAYRKYYLNHLVKIGYLKKVGTGYGLTDKGSDFVDMFFGE